MPELEYSCFLHPKNKSNEYPDVCPECGLSYTFPMDIPPKQIGKYEVIKSLNRGFYGVTYVVKNRAGIKSTIKIIPKKTYSKEEGYGKEFYEEVENHRIATESDVNVPNLLDAHECVVKFNEFKIEIECYCILMKYIDGMTLKEFKNSNEINANRIAQIAYDLFDFLRKMESIGLHHNDLHDGNIMIEISGAEIGRLNAIDRTAKAYIIDMGSTAHDERSGEYCRDVTWIIRHINDMVNFYWDKTDQREEHRILSRLLHLAITCSGKENVRETNFEEYCNQIYTDVKQGANPWAYPKKLITVGDYYNTQLMPMHYAPDLFYDPEDKWTNNLIKPGPILLTGMRGCGKTILLKSLHFFARTQERSGENKGDVVKRLKNENHVGLFVSASTLLTDPKSKEMHLPNHKLILAYSEDLIKCIRYCEWESIGDIDYIQIEHLCTTLEELIPWFEKPANCCDLTAIEMKIESARLKARKIINGDAGELNVHDAFNVLAKRTQNCIDIWNNKHVIFLLDDLSARYLKQDNVNEVLSQLNFQTEKFSFKISTETPTLRLRTGAGEISRIDRDYEEFDLGNEVIQVLKNSGPSFMENVLKKRFNMINEYRGISPTKLLGSQNYTDIARNLADKKSKSRGSYWGIKALGSLSTGDIGDSIIMFQRMLEKIESGTTSIPTKIQDAVIFNFSEKKLRSLANQKKWLYDHANSFAVASQVQLRTSYAKHLENSNKKIRQYNEIFLRIDPEGADNIFDRINELVEGGVFVFAGGTPRSKSPEKKASLFLKLAYRKILGVTNLMPISNSDRFEISGADLEDWLENPTADKLSNTVGKNIATENESIEKELSEWNWTDNEEEKNEKEKDVTSAQKSIAQFMPKEIDENNDECYLPFTIESKKLRKLKDTDVIGKHIIGALGFEDRSIGTWKNILSSEKPDGLTLILYDEPGLKDNIINVLNKDNINFNIISYSDIVTFDGDNVEKDNLKQFIEGLPNNDIVLDVTSMNKPLIFLLTSGILKQRKELGIIHTSAEEYLPLTEDFGKVLQLLDTDLPLFFEEADKLIEGEFNPQSKMTIWQNRDPGSSVYLICFISLKYSRVKKLLEELSTDFIDIICPLSTSGNKSVRSKFAEEIAQILISETGNIWATESNDHLDAYRIITERYTKYALESGVNVEIGLTGVKMHTVAAGMLASVANFSGVYYTPIHFDPNKYSKGTGDTTFTMLKMKRVEFNIDSD